MRRTRSDQRGAATVELALALPLLVAVTTGLVWLLGVGAAQVCVVDAARETARAAARGDNSDEAVARGLQVAPPGSTITVHAAGSQVTAVARGEVGGPGILGLLPAVTLRAQAVAALEPTGASP